MDPVGGDAFPWIAFAGSESADDWRINLDIRPIDPGHGLKGKIHNGFATQWGHARAEVNKKVANLRAAGHKRVIITGHSLGGAVATLCAGELSKENPDMTFELITFGAPKAASNAYAADFNTRFNVEPKDSAGDGGATRMMNSGDPVPCIPPGYSDDVAGGLVWNAGSDQWTEGQHRQKSCLRNVFKMAVSHHAMTEYIGLIEAKC